MKLTPVFALTLSLVFAVEVRSALVGTSPPALSLTADRIAVLPADQREAWAGYLARSKKQMSDDRHFFVAEFKSSKLKTPIEAPGGHDAKSVPMNKPASWYGTAEAKRIADIIVSFQTPAGGWSKNIDLAIHPRQPGERFSHDGGTPGQNSGDYDRPVDVQWSYVGTFDNDATITELRYLAKVISALPVSEAVPYRAAFSRGLGYVLGSQYPNGGWPQVWPLEGGYHDAITFNDGAMLHVLAFQGDVAGGKNEFNFVTPEERERAVKSFQHGIACLLACQITEDGRRTVWSQQNDMLTLQPCSARNYEMPAQASAESSEITLYLMENKNPGPDQIVAIKAAAAWFKKTAIYGQTFTRVGNSGRVLVATPGAGPIWPRYVQIGTDRPIFGDRDKTIHDDVGDISQERRNGYAWFNAAATRVLDHYGTWLNSVAKDASKRE
ncbi:MAG TPA: pectate lyase [Lacunisphaera sp.]|jgi:PelA/Pel-15E family pectate lyase